MGATGRTGAPELAASARARQESFVRWTIEAERPFVAALPRTAERETFLAYYRGLPRPDDGGGLRRLLRGLRRNEAGWAARWIAARERPRVLDAGSGFGTYAMLFAVLGADVTGVDLRPDRLDVADQRLGWYRQQTGNTLAVRYRRADLTRPWDADYDLVWIYNAISHIDPLDAFLQQVHDHLKPGGVMVVGDINGAHPSHLRRLARERREVHQKYVAPDGQRHAYAVERTFSPGEMREIVTRNGLRVVWHELFWGGLGALPDLVYRPFLQPVQRRWWLGRSVARRQLLVAARAGS